MTGEGVRMSDEDGAGSIGAIPPPARRRSLLPLLILTLLAFALGVALTIWAWPQVQRRWGETLPAATLPAAPARQAPMVQPLTATAAQSLDSRIVQLEERLTRITIEAQAASGNASRAEGLLVAFAARRALDTGAPLGYLEGQLRLRFGQGQPRAVAAIIAAAREPITLTDLRSGLSAIGDRVTQVPADAGWWSALEREARELITIRKATTPSARPELAMERALRYIDGGRVAAALAEVERLPGRGAADRWIQAARRYLEARRALDLIETAAILEPRPLGTVESLPTAQNPPAP
jgi:outer membrane murein-binding lipoprotein Lpp